MTTKPILALAREAAQQPSGMIQLVHETVGGRREPAARGSRTCAVLRGVTPRTARRWKAQYSARRTGSGTAAPAAAARPRRGNDELRRPARSNKAISDGGSGGVIKRASKFVRLRGRRSSTTSSTLVTRVRRCKDAVEGGGAPAVRRRLRRVGRERRTRTSPKLPSAGGAARTRRWTARASRPTRQRARGPARQSRSQVPARRCRPAGRGWA